MPRVDFASLKLASFGKSENGFFLYDSSQLDVQTIAQSVSIGGDILPITPPFPNFSWHLDFDGLLWIATTSTSLPEMISSRMSN